MTQGQPFNATNDDGTCLWCGRKLRTFVLDKAPTKATQERDMRFHPNEQAQIEKREKERQERVRKNGQRKGDYGDGHFCGLRCGYDFGVAFAGFGKRLQPPTRNTDNDEGGIE